MNIPNVPEGDFIIRASYYAGYPLYRWVTIKEVQGSVNASDDGATINIAIRAFSGNITGTVFAADGQTAVSSVYLEVLDNANTRLAYAYADNNGNYQFTNIIAENGFIVRAYHPYESVYIDASGAFTTAGETVTINLTLPISTIKGTVYYNDGATPVPNSSIYLTADNGYYGRYRSGSDGTYTAFGPPVGNFTVNAQASDGSGLMGSASGAITAIDAPASVNVRLQPAGTVTGVVRDYTGNIAPNADIRLNSSGSIYTRYEMADSQGVYTINNVAAGDITVTAMYSGNEGPAGRAAAVLTADKETITINVNYEPAGTVTGRVYDEFGAPASNKYVYLRNSNPLQYERGAYTDASGAFTFINVPLGDITVRTDRGISTGRLQTNGESLNIDIILVPTGAVTGIVRSADGAPVSSAYVTIENSALQYRTSAYISDNGQFVFASVPAGDFALTATWNGLPGSASGRINSSNDVVTVNITLLGSGTVTGTVFDIDGATPVPNADIGIISDIGANIDIMQTADGSGNFLQEYVPIGGFTLVAYDPVNKRYGLQKGAISVNGETATMNISTTNNTGSIRVTAYDETGAALMANVFVRIRDMFNNVIYEGITDANGQVTITNFPVLGGFRIWACAGGGEGCEYEGNVNGFITEPSQTVEIKITLGYYDGD